MEIMFGFIIGLVIMVAAVFLIEITRKKQNEKIISELKDSFSSISFETLSKTSNEFLKLAGQLMSSQTQTNAKELENKKSLIDRSLDSISREIQRVQELMQSLEKDRENKFGQITAQIKNMIETNAKLQNTTENLKIALSSSKIRGHWGEKMAEDVLRFAGFVEGINYTKQTTLDNSMERPDFTFFLPKNLKIHMDVKFPLDNYLKSMNANSEQEQKEYGFKFIDDVRKIINIVTSKNYAREENTIDYVLIFIPNEQVFYFINEHEPTLLDEAMKKKAILCSPLTLYAVLAVIRQAVENFSFEQNLKKIIAIIGKFSEEWNKFIQTMDEMGEKLEDATKKYNALMTTRKNKLEKTINQIDDFKRQKVGAVEIPYEKERD